MADITETFQKIRKGSSPHEAITEAVSGKGDDMVPDLPSPEEREEAVRTAIKRTDGAEIIGKSVEADRQSTKFRYGDRKFWLETTDPPGYQNFIHIEIAEDTGRRPKELGHVKIQDPSYQDVFNHAKSFIDKYVV